MNQENRDPDDQRPAPSAEALHMHAAGLPDGHNNRRYHAVLPKPHVWVAWWEPADASQSFILGAFRKKKQAKKACQRWIPPQMAFDVWEEEDYYSANLWTMSDVDGKNGTWHVLLMTIEG